MFLAQHSEPDAAAGSRMVPGVRGKHAHHREQSCRLHGGWRATLRVLCRSPGVRWARSIPTRSSASAFFAVSETVGHGRDDNRSQRQLR